MAKMVYSRRFIESAAGVQSSRVYEDLLSTMRAVETFPGIGSSDMPQSIRALFGDKVRKVVFKPFDVVYEYDESEDTVYVYDLIPCKMAR